MVAKGFFSVICLILCGISCAFWIIRVCSLTRDGRLEMTDSSFTSDLQGGKYYKFVDHSDSYTYKVKEDAECGVWVMNCVVKITTIVRGDDGDAKEGGCLATAYFANDEIFDTFIPNNSWDTVDQFKTALRLYSTGMPAIFCRFSQPDFQVYGEDRMRTFKRQDDGETIVFGPKQAFLDKGDMVEYTPLESTDYAWIPTLLPELSISLETSEPGTLFADAAKTFHGDNLYSFALTLGGFYMGLHYEKMIKSFHRCPTVFCVGNTNCGKTWAVVRSANFIASNGAALMEHKSLTPAAARNALSQQGFPLLWQDPSAVDAVKTLIEENYDGKSVTTMRDRTSPRTSLIVTCNPDFYVQLRNLDQMRALVRCAPVPFNGQFKERKAVEMLAQAGLPTCSRDLVEQLLRMSAQDLTDIAVELDDIQKPIVKKLEGYGMVESVDRIGFNIALNFSCTVKALSILDRLSAIDVDGLRDFVHKDVVKFAATWQAPSGIKRKYLLPEAPQSPSKKPAGASFLSPMDVVLEKTMDALEPSELIKVIRICKEGVAFKDKQAISLMTAKKVDSTFATECKSHILKIPGARTSWDVKFPGKKTALKAMTIPLFAVSPSIIKRIESFETGTGKNESLAEDPASDGELLDVSGNLTPSTLPVYTAANEGAILPAEGEKAPDNEVSAPQPKETESGTTNLESEQTEDETKIREKFPSPAPREIHEVGSPGLGSEVQTSSTQRKDNTAGDSESSGSQISKFQPGIVSETVVRPADQKCAHCGSGFPVPGQRLRCQKCDHYYHRNCQKVRNHHFLRDRAAAFQCIPCKEQEKANAKE